MLITLENKKIRKIPVLIVAVIYVTITVFWAVISVYFLASFIGDVENLYLLLIKDIVFVCFTGVFLFVLSKVYFFKYKKKEQAVFQSKNRLSHALNAANEGLIDWDIIGGELYLSEKTLEIFELNNNPFSSLISLIKFINKAGQKKDQEEIKKIVNAGGNSFEYQFCFLDKNGDQKWALLKCDIQRDTFSGKASRLLGVVSDITNFKNTEALLIETKKFLEMIFSQTIEGIAFFVLDQPIDFRKGGFNLSNDTMEKALLDRYNKVFLKQLGQDSEGLKGKLLKDVFGFFETCYTINWEQLFRTGKCKSKEQLVFKGGKKIWLDTEFILIKGDNKEIVGLFLIQRDVTKQERSERIEKFVYRVANTSRYLKNEDLYSLIYEEFSSIIGVKNMFIAFYDEEKGIFDVPYLIDERLRLSQFEAKKTRSLYVLEKKQPFLFKEKAMDDLVEKGEIKIIGEKSKLWMGVPLKICGEYKGVISIQDYNSENAFNEEDMQVLELASEKISKTIERQLTGEQLQIAKEQAKQAEKLKSAFLASMSHEIRTPLNAILGFSDLIVTDGITDEQKAHFTEYIKKSSEDLLMLVGDIVDIATIEAEQLNMQDDKFSINEIINEVYEKAKLYLEEKRESNNLIVKKQIPDEYRDYILEKDRQRYVQILMNIINNAIKFTSKGSVSIGYEVDTKDKEVTVIVKDTGIGIDEDKRDAVFETFRQVDGSITKKYGGTGLGMAISKKLTDKMGGKIWFESKSKEGTSFYVSLEYVEEKGRIKETVGTDEVDAGIKLEEKVILIAEDENINYLLLKELLSETKAEIIKASDGKEALELVKERTIDLIFMDIQMPIMNGIEATRAIKKIRPELPIVAQTAYATSADKKKCMDAGCNDYIPKPINPKVLMKKLYKIFR